jgi:hypothetical protein
VKLISMILTTVYLFTVISYANALPLAIRIDIAFIGIFITRNFFEDKTILDSLQFWLKHPLSMISIRYFKYSISTHGQSVVKFTNLRYFPLDDSSQYWMPFLWSFPVKSETKPNIEVSGLKHKFYLRIIFDQEESQFLR